VRLRAASQRAELDVEKISLTGDRLSAQGSVTSRAQGIVRLRYSYFERRIRGEQLAYELNAGQTRTP